jgi:ABC-type transporter Mla MlaB component
LNTGTAAYCIDETGVVRVDSAATVLEAMNPCSGSGKPPLQ